MKSVLPLRLASLLAFSNFILHTYLFQLYEPLRGQDELASFSVIQSGSFSGSGFLYNFLDMYVGIGLFVILATLVECGLLWYLAEVERTARTSMRSMVMPVLIVEAIYMWVMWQSQLTLPTLLHASMVALLTMAVFPSEAGGGRRTAAA